MIIATHDFTQWMGILTSTSSTLVKHKNTRWMSQKKISWNKYDKALSLQFVATQIIVQLVKKHISTQKQQMLLSNAR